ncbi:MAG: hypothetical protein KGO96_07740 [Elusimicrobia bacterium]|nr:hypothetical protein [Elusimicrobiota bacterium]
MGIISTIATGVGSMATGGALGNASVGGASPEADNTSLFQNYNNSVQFANNISQKNFFHYSAVNSFNFNKYYPYQIAILQKTSSNDSVSSDSPVDSASSSFSSSYQVFNGFRLTLPVPPQSLSIVAPFASTTQVTLGGIVEEHAGLPTRIINISGTTGVVPGREGANNLSQSGLLASTSSTFAGALSTAQNFSSLISSTGLNTGSTNVYSFPDLTSTNNNNVGRIGYVSFRLLEVLLEIYADLKAKGDKDSKDYRLAFFMWKDDAIYIVTPMSFEKKRDADRPLEYLYNLKLKAWQRIPLFGSPPTVDVLKITDSLSPTVASQVFNRLRDARNTLQSLKDTIIGVRQDANLIFQQLREVAMIGNDMLGVAQTLNDLPVSIVQDLKYTVIDSWSNFAQNLHTTGQILSKTPFNLAQINTIMGQSNTNTSTLYSAQSSYLINNDNTSGNVNKMQVPAPFGIISPLFDDPDKTAYLFSQIQVNSLKISPAINKAIQDQLAISRARPKSFFQNIINNIKVVSDAFADLVGLGNSSYNSTYNRTAIPQIRTATDNDTNVLYAFNESIMALKSLIAPKSINTKNIVPTQSQYIAALANKSGINFTIPQSKFSIPMPYGVTLERLASLYLGDPDRWIEISAINNLREPYIDEVGFDVAIVSPPVSNQITVSSVQNIYKGQLVWLTGPSVTTFKTTIEEIKQISNNTFVLTVDITSGLDFPQSLVGFNNLHAYLPFTTNSQQLIYIPSDKPSDTQDPTDYLGIPGVNNLDGLLAVGGIDLLLDTNNDRSYYSARWYKIFIWSCEYSSTY